MQTPASTIRDMENELAQLEQRIDAIVALNHKLRSENSDLHARIAALEADKRRLGDKLQRAIAGVEAALQQLPEA